MESEPPTQLVHAALGQKRTSEVRLRNARALPPKADIDRVRRNVRFVSLAFIFLLDGIACVLVWLLPEPRGAGRGSARADQ